MTIRSDPEKNELRTLFDTADLAGKSVLEIGCGDGRLTFRYADRAAHVTAVDPWQAGIDRAEKNLPDGLREYVDFHCSSFEDFAGGCGSDLFDVAILSWSL